ncbi:MAG: sugar ABC transporter substrate-binding protein, partial [Devosia sp.]|nr:sugar ABC transporter substrate-binding protein [Devosia sp.]
MTNMQGRAMRPGSPFRRQVVACAMTAVTTASLMSTTVYAQSVDLGQWSPDYIKSIAGTETFDTAGHCAGVVPLDYAGKLSYWWTGPTEASPRIEHEINDAFWAAWAETYPNIETDAQNIDYNQLLDRLRTTLLGNAGPMAVRLQILGGVEFSSKGYFQELSPEDIGYPT